MIVCFLLRLSLFRSKVKQNVVKAYGGVEVQFRTFLKLELQVGKPYDSAA